MLRMQNHRYGLRTEYPTLQSLIEDDELEEMVAGWAQTVPLEDTSKARSSKEAAKEMQYWISTSRGGQVSGGSIRRAALVESSTGRWLHTMKLLRSPNRG
jgi:hypothetical protein